jgi:hypothetical protein
MFKGLTSKSLLWSLVTLTILGPASSAWAFEDVATGRWMTRDPDGDVNGANPYVFNGSNPNRWFDPTGRIIASTPSRPRKCCPATEWGKTCGGIIDGLPACGGGGGSGVGGGGGTGSVDAGSHGADTSSQTPTGLEIPLGRTISEKPWWTLLWGKTDEECCELAMAAGLDEGHLGGVICCEGRKVPCSWVRARMSPHEDPSALTILDDCMDRHEQTHLDDIDCGPVEGWITPTRPPYRDASQEKAQECIAHCAEKQCLLQRQGECTSYDGLPSLKCWAAVRSRVEDVESWIDWDCGSTRPPGCWCCGRYVSR